MNIYFIYEQGLFCPITTKQFDIFKKIYGLPLTDLERKMKEKKREKKRERMKAYY